MPAEKDEVPWESSQDLIERYLGSIPEYVYFLAWGFATFTILMAVIIANWPLYSNWDLVGYIVCSLILGILLPLPAWMLTFFVVLPITTIVRGVIRLIRKSRAA